MRRSTLRLVTSLFVALALMGCEEEPIQVGRSLTPAPAQGETVPGQAVDAGVEEEDQAPSFRDDDFVEADTNRDPFRSFASMFQIATAQRPGEVGRDVEMNTTSVEEMRVIGIISGVANPYAMIVDREGVGHTVSRGQYIGRSEVVQAGTTEDLAVTLNWRVERIRPGEVVLTREDPTAPNRPALTRVLPLRDEDEELSLGGVRPRGDARAAGD